MNVINEYGIFETIKKLRKDGTEYWSARELSKILQYKKWDKFLNVIERAKRACKNSEIEFEEHFPQVEKTIKMPKNAQKIVVDYELSRYACYLIVQNADPNKEVIALGQTYFAIQTRKQEISEKDYNLLTEDEKRIYQRNSTKKANYSLNQVAKNAGVKNFDQFHNSGYKGLYNGETADDIAKRKGLRYREEILDNMCSDELIINLFRISQTEQKIRNNNITAEKEANKAHYEMGRDIRKFIAKQNGTMPEDLPTPKKSVKELEKGNRRKLLGEEHRQEL
jgi:DNA-damage-inducible protein D